MKKILGIIVIFVASQAYADNSSQRWEFEVGAGAEREATFMGADEYETEFMPYIQAEYTGDWFNVRLGDENRLVFNPVPSFEWWVGVDPFEFGERLEADASVLTGLGDIDSELGIELGGTYQLTPSVELDLNYLSGGDQGSILEAETTYEIDLSSQLELELAAGLTWADSDHMQTMFGVTQTQSQNSGLNRFDAGSGIRDYHLGLDFDYEFNDNWSGRFMLEAIKYTGDAADSPIIKNIGSDTSVEALAGIIYRF